MSDFERPLAQNDPRRMQLTEEERGWALDIKDAIEMFPELDNLSDFVYATLAVAVKDNVEDAVRRAHQLQAFREEYGLKDTLQESQHIIAKAVQQHPSLCYDVSFHPKQGKYILVQDIAAFSPTEEPTTQQVEDFAIFGYYLLHALFPDLESTRRGYTVFVECEGFSVANNKHMFKLMDKFYSEVMAVYPSSEGTEARHLNAPTFFNVMTAGLRKLLPEELQDKFFRGPSLPGLESSLAGRRLDTLYLTPTPELATQRAIAKLKANLERRYKNIASFSLNLSEEEVVLDGPEEDIVETS